MGGFKPRPRRQNLLPLKDPRLAFATQGTSWDLHPHEVLASANQLMDPPPQIALDALK